MYINMSNTNEKLQRQAATAFAKQWEGRGYEKRPREIIGYKLA